MIPLSIWAIGAKLFKNQFYSIAIWFLYSTLFIVPAMNSQASDGSMTQSTIQPDVQTTIQIDTSATPSVFYYPDPVVIQARLNGPQPIIGARVSAEITAPCGANQQLSLHETAGTMPQDLMYQGAMVSLKEDGLYSVKILAEDNQSRAAFITGMESEPRPGQDMSTVPVVIPPFKVIQFFQFTAHGYGVNQEVKPQKVTDLFIESDPEGCFRLSWTAPLSLKDGSRLEIRASHQSLISETAWREAQCLFSGVYSVKGNERQVKKVCFVRKGRYFVALRSWSPGGLESEISNDYLIEVN